MAGREREAVHAYHERSKHHLRRFAASLGTLDWATQPDPFRRFEGSRRHELPLATGPGPAWSELMAPGRVASRPLDVAGLGAFFELALGLTAWKQLGRSRWALRANPSSGNLHPTEAYVVLAGVGELPAGLFHYLSETHALEERCRLDAAGTARLKECLPAGRFLVGLSSIHWREAWKYGERAWRYCQHDAGHALGALRYAAAALGWSTCLATDVADSRVSTLLGLDRRDDYADVPPAEAEHPDAVLVVVTSPPQAASNAGRLGGVAEEIEALLRRGTWSGHPNRLSPGHVEWPAIDAVAEAARYPAPTGPDIDGTASGAAGPGRDPAVALPPLEQQPEAEAFVLIRQRRSAVDMDGATGMDAHAFFRLLDTLLPRPGVPPLDVLPWRPRIHLLLFVHRVEGLEPGLYVLAREREAVGALRETLSPGLAWQRVVRAPAHLDLYLLLPSDVREAARLVSCQQDIAADGAFSLGMLAAYRSSIEQGSWWYRRLFWEAGLVGQALYLGAEASGLRGTGIGCYFDDAVHDLVGVSDDRFQDLYHFTVGAPVDDPRLTTLPPYGSRS